MPGHSVSSGPATVYWITGLAGAGKTTIGTALRQLLLRNGRHAVLLDGDAVRQALGGGHGHSVDERRHLAHCYGRLCKLLADQGTDVVCATVSMFESVRQWNRSNIADYREIYVITPAHLLHERRALYRDADDADVVGRNPAYELPENSDLVVTNDGHDTPDEIARQILAVAPAAA